MSTASELEREVNDLRQIVAEPTPQEELAAKERQLAAALEAEAEAAAYEWRKGNARAIGGAASEMDRILEQPPEKISPRDAATANGVWAKIVRRLELDDVVVRRFPHGKSVNVPTVLPPGRRGLDVPGLSIASPARQLHPVILASDSPALRAAIFAVEAHAWLRGRGAELPDDLRAAIAVAPPAPDFTERAATQRAETARRRAAAWRVGI